MRPEDFEQLETMHASLAGTFGAVASPESAIPRVLVAMAALAPIAETGRDQRLVGVEWLTPALLDAVEQVGGALGALYDELESALDGMTILEPGTIGAQTLVDMPTADGRPVSAGRPPGTRGELIR